MKCSQVLPILAVLFAVTVYRWIDEILIAWTYPSTFDPKTSWLYTARRTQLLKDYTSYIPAEPIPELYVNATWEELARLTNGFDKPAVIRQMWVTNEENHKKLRDLEWWRNLKNNDSESVETNCLNLGQASLLPCTYKEWVDNWDPKITKEEDRKNWYIGGPTQYVFEENPQLFDIIHDDNLERFFEDGKKMGMHYKTPQKFMGFQGHGTPIHTAGPFNLFVQISGVKKWWFLHWDYKVHLNARYAEHGISIHTDGKTNPYAEFLTYLPRWEVDIHPGDVLFWPSWMFHGTNIPEEENILDSFNNGVVYRVGGRKSAWYALTTAPFPFLAQIFQAWKLGGGSIARGKDILMDGRKMRDWFNEGFGRTAKQVEARS